METESALKCSGRVSASPANSKELPQKTLLECTALTKNLDYAPEISREQGVGIPFFYFLTLHLSLFYPPSYFSLHFLCAPVGCLFK